MIRLKLQYLGTAAAEAFPGVFCHCETCQKARKLGGKNIRRRSGMVVNDTTPDRFPTRYLRSLSRFGLDLGSVTDLVVTHSMRTTSTWMNCPCVKTACSATSARTRRPCGYTATTVSSGRSKRLGWTPRPYLDFSPLTYFEPLRLPNGLVFTPLPASHAKGENAWHLPRRRWIPPYPLRSRHRLVPGRGLSLPAGKKLGFCLL